MRDYVLDYLHREVYKFIHTKQRIAMNHTDRRRDHREENQGPNMRLLVISGPLGSGKTTLTVQLAENAIKKNLKAAILVNEIGEVGIDDQFMRRLDLNVWEIVGGCICCTLAGSLQETLLKLETEYAPDIVLLEPSGVADLKVIERIVGAPGSPAAIQQRTVVVVDPLRLEMMMTIITPLITSQVKAAEWAIINKMDVAEPPQLEYAHRIVNELNPRARVFTISSKSKLPVTLVDGLLL